MGFASVTWMFSELMASAFKVPSFNDGLLSSRSGFIVQWVATVTLIFNGWAANRLRAEAITAYSRTTGGAVSFLSILCGVRRPGELGVRHPKSLPMKYEIYFSGLLQVGTETFFSSESK